MITVLPFAVYQCSDDLAMALLTCASLYRSFIYPQRLCLIHRLISFITPTAAATTTTMTVTMTMTMHDIITINSTVI